MNEIQYTVGPGDIVIVLPGSYRSARSCGPFRHAAARLHWVRSDGERHLVSAVELPEWLVLPGRIHVGLPAIEELLDLLRQANVESELRRPGSHEMVDALLRQLLVHLYRHAGKQQTAGAPDQHGGTYGPVGVDEVDTQIGMLNRALEYVHHHLHRSIYIAEVAQACGYSEPHLRRLFRQHVSMTPTEYITRARIERAQRLLHTNQFTISQVAAAVGFTDPFHFSRKFKSVVCVPPRAYRTKEARAR